MSTAKLHIGAGAKPVCYTQDNGSQVVLLAPGGRVLGRYLKASNQTLDASGNLVGYGNLLFTLAE